MCGRKGFVDLPLRASISFSRHLWVVIISMDDLATLPPLTEKTLLKNLHDRYKKDAIYVRTFGVRATA